MVWFVLRIRLMLMRFSNETALDCGDESVTQQCFKDECDINILLAKFAVTGQLPDNVRVPQFVDFEETF